MDYIDLSSRTIDFVLFLRDDLRHDLKSCPAYLYPMTNEYLRLKLRLVDEELAKRESQRRGVVLLRRGYDPEMLLEDCISDAAYERERRRLEDLSQSAARSAVPTANPQPLGDGLSSP